MKKKPISEKEKIEKAIRDRSLAFNKNSAEITGDFNIAVAVLQIEKIVGQIIKSEGMLFSIGGQVGHLTVAYKIHNDWIYDALTLNNYCNNPNLVEEIAESFPKIILTPCISLFISRLRDVFVEFIDMDIDQNHDEIVKTRIDMLNTIIDSIRMEAE